jgi:uncharacterized protein (TIGR02996 family)
LAMTDGDSLFRAVLTNPDDDAPRLVWADWLEEHGEAGYANWLRERVAAFRSDLKAKHPPEVIYTPVGRAATVVMHHMNVKKEATWVKELAPAYDREVYGVAYALKRGHVYRLECEVVELVQDRVMGRRVVPAPVQLGDIFSRCPITEVLIRDDRVRIRPAGPGLARVRGQWCFEIMGWTGWCHWKRTYSWADGRPYQDQHDAAMGLNLALVNYGRELAGLPALEYAEGGTMRPLSEPSRIPSPPHQDFSFERLLPDPT